VAKNQVREHAERRERPTLGSAIDLMIAAPISFGFSEPSDSAVGGLPLFGG
jgi:hypothetical protein